MKKTFSLLLTAALTAASLNGCQTESTDTGLTPVTLNEVRSEERRVGKEC